MERKEESLSTDEWNPKYKEQFVSKHIEEDTNLDLFHYVVSKLDVLRIKTIIGYSRSDKFVKEINKEFKKCVESLSDELHINKSKL